MKIRKKIAKHRAVLGWGLGYLNLLLIPLIAADVLQRHLYARSYIGEMPFIYIWVVLVLLSWGVGTVALKLDLVGEQSKFETEQVLKSASNSLGRFEKEE